MLAIPIKTLGENPSISDYFGKSKWFAIIDKDIMSFEKNTHKSGCAVVDWLYDLGVTETIISHIGPDPLHKLYNMDIECLYTKDKAVTLEDVFNLISKEKLIKLDRSNEQNVIDHLKGCHEVCE